MSSIVYDRIGNFQVDGFLNVGNLISGSFISASGSISGSSIGIPVGGTFSPPTGSTSGSLVSGSTMKVNITGSTYYVQLWR